MNPFVDDIDFNKKIAWISIHCPECSDTWEEEEKPLPFEYEVTCGWCGHKFKVSVSNTRCFDIDDNEI